MDALVMCGGRGTRLHTRTEKPLFEIGGRPMVDHVLDALADPVETTYAVVSPHTPATAAHVDVPTIETAGEGYVHDLQAALEVVDRPVLTVVADLPLLRRETVRDVLDAYDSGSLAVYVPVSRKRELGVSVDTSVERDDRLLAPSGLHVVGGDPERRVIREDVELAVNVNRRTDAAVAEERR